VQVQLYVKYQISREGTARPANSKGSDAAYVYPSSNSTVNGPRSYQVPCGASVSRRVFSLVLRLIGACHCTRQAPPPHSPRALAQGWAHGIPIGIAVHRYTLHKLLLQRSRCTHPRPLDQGQGVPDLSCCALRLRP